MFSRLAKIWTLEVIVGLPFCTAAGEQPMTVYDLHATILHSLGIDHTRLTYYHNGLNRRLTDVHGHAICEAFA